MTTPDLLILLYVIAAGYLWLGDLLLWKCGLTRSRMQPSSGLWPFIVAVWMILKLFRHSR